MGPKLRLIIGALLTVSGVYSLVPHVSAGGEDTYFVATAYYSPLPGQTKYTTGSYAGDKRLNGEGHTTASGKEVFPGLLAGPKNYPFGTKIYFEGYGIGVIEDRGGAIVKAGERGHSYDRLDIWMGYGDEGLQRALRWGTRTIKGKIVVPSAEVSLKFGESPLGVLTKLQVTPEGSLDDDVKALQTIFTKTELYSGEIDGKYNSIKNELIEFQLQSEVINSREDPAAGWYGPKTIAALRETYGSADVILIQEPSEYYSRYNHSIASEKYKTILEYGDLVVNPDSTEESIRLLQQLLQDLGEYSGQLDGKYSSVEQSLIDLQLKIGLIGNSSDWGAGYFGNATKSALWKYYEVTDPSEKGETYQLSQIEIEKLTLAVKNLKISQGVKYAEILGEQISEILPRYSDTSKIKAQLLLVQELL